MTAAEHIPDWLGVAASVLLVLIAVAVSVRASLGLTRELLWAALRAFVQLLAVGSVLTLLFTRTGLLGALAWVAGMVVIAGFVAAGRSRELPRGRSVAWIAVGVAASVTLGVPLVLGVVEPVPSVVVPVGGMVVSGAMTATNLTMRRMADIAEQQRPDIEARLLLPDANDIHVLAVAISSQADAIITFNAKDFPRHLLADEGVERLDPDQLLCQIHARHPAEVAQVVAGVHATAERMLAEDIPMKSLMKRAQLRRLAKAIEAAGQAGAGQAGAGHPGAGPQGARG